MLDWLIVGGGIHGTALSFYLTRVAGVRAEAVRVLDPHPEPLALWTQHTTNTGMTYLRSPHVHSLDRDPWSMATFAQTRAGAALAEYIPTHNRPSLALFSAHSRWMIERHGLDRMRLTGRATGLRRTPNGWRVETGEGGIDAQRVILAVGATEQPDWPGWARNLRQEGANISHVFDADFKRDRLPAWQALTVVGGGITAAQLALALAERAPGSVTLLMRHPARVHPFDSDLRWVGAPALKGFRAEPDYRRRRAIILEARHRGSMPADVHATLTTAAKASNLRIVGGELEAAMYSNRTITLTTRGETITSDCVVLATGFSAERPGGAWLESAIAEYGLPVAPDGYPTPDPRLCWRDGLYVTGPLAELEVGPPARNIIGARLAAELICADL